MNGISWLLIAAVAGASVAHVVLLVRRIRRRVQPDDAVHHVKCPHCGRRLRYRSKQVGRAGMCPRCRQKLVFPPASEAAGKQ